MRINIYGRPNCSGCEAAKTLLDRKGWDYTYHNMMEMKPYDAQHVLNESGMRSVPIVKVDDIYIGGYDQLEAYIRGVEERKV
jgi:glutaredoxin